MGPTMHDVVRMLSEREQHAPVFRLGVIPANYTTGRPTVIFDGEVWPSWRTYPVLDHVTTLAPGKTVVVLMHEGNGIIIGAYTR